MSDQLNQAIETIEDSLVVISKNAEHLTGPYVFLLDRTVTLRRHLLDARKRDESYVPKHAAPVLW